MPSKYLTMLDRAGNEPREDQLMGRLGDQVRMQGAAKSPEASTVKTTMTIVKFRLGLVF
jgi:hypothetical protein